MSLASLNPEAGDHPIGSDADELAVAFKAAERSWREFPYYELRYADRGRRFCTSDAAWIVSLCDRRGGDSIEQLVWLGAVLSSRGMPQFLLEHFVATIHEALVAAMPSRAPRFDVLAAGVRRLERMRRSQIVDRDFRELAAAFGGDEIPRFGELLVSAVADEGLGIEHAVDSLEAWACDPARFGERWIAAVRTTIAEARARRGGG